MIPYDEDHIEPPSAFSDQETKREYGRELAFSSLIKGSYRKSATQERYETFTPIERGSAIELPEPASVASTKTIPFPAQNRRRISKRLILALAASIAAVTAPLWLGKPDAPSLQNPRLTLSVSSVKGEVSVTNEETGRSHTPAVGDLILSGDRVVTGRKSSIRLAYPDGTIVQVNSFTDIKSRINENNLNAKNLFMKAGRITVKAQKQPEHERMAIHTPTAVAEVVGTYFILNATEERTELIVNEGTVDFKSNAGLEKIRVESGHVANITPQGQRLEEVHPEVTSFSLVDVETGSVIPGYEEISGENIVSFSDLPLTGIGIRANVSGLTDMVEMNHPKLKQFQKEDYDFTQSEEIRVGYKAIDTDINPYSVTATPYSRKDGSGTPQKLTLKFVP